ncbi:uncharacterized protein EAF01_001619 [Botrytis porri]|uniref:AB hydrolase-1 domain-containing protein n=1 Tax=Botrytis porri TaxID=87229 RepID=A0A4Z1KZ98_9HELO|nr:uncharacterized protein EAF01_001619 [Botrytis porri]KAF7912598.1 hypothetical protein EAF01_001619 [Botrytis porri]TGO89857.1 hypothetical protein BPOR_0090g00040 [Botrytis porri]
MSFAILPSKPQTPLAYKLIESQDINPDSPLIVFINGLGLPSVSWTSTIALLQQSTSSIKPSILTYDRYGQGATTSQDPADNIPGKYPGYGHDLNDAVNDLQELIQVTIPTNPKLVLVAASIGRTFNTDVKSPEGLDRRNVLHLLPNPSSPKLQRLNGKGSWLKDIGHDPELFAEEMWRLLKIPKSLNRKYTQPAWQKYNEELLTLTDADRSGKEVLIAPGCGYLIQKDNPQFVATQLEDLLSKFRSEVVVPRQNLIGWKIITKLRRTDRKETLFSLKRMVKMTGKRTREKFRIGSVQWSNLFETSGNII